MLDLVVAVDRTFGETMMYSVTPSVTIGTLTAGVSAVLLGFLFGRKLHLQAVQPGASVQIKRRRRMRVGFGNLYFFISLIPSKKEKTGKQKAEKRKNRA